MTAPVSPHLHLDRKYHKEEGYKENIPRLYSQGEC